LLLFFFKEAILEFKYEYYNNFSSFNWLIFYTTICIQHSVNLSSISPMVLTRRRKKFEILRRKEENQSLSLRWEMYRYAICSLCLSVFLLSLFFFDYLTADFYCVCMSADQIFIFLTSKLRYKTNFYHSPFPGSI
jgi:hypothetical protein